MFGLSTVAIEAIAAAVIALSIFGCGLKAGVDLETRKYDELKLEYVQAQDKAAAAAAALLQQNENAAAAASTERDAATAQIAAAVRQEQADVKPHIILKTINANCVPYGFLRVLYAGSHGVTANSLSYGAGQSDEACAPIGWADLASAIIHDYGQARSNGDQLTALQNLLTKQGVKVR